MSTATTTTPAAPAAPPGALTLGLRRVGIELKTFFRDRNSAVWNFLLPVMLLIIFGSVFGNQNLGEGLDITFAQYFVAGMIASGVLYPSFPNLAIAIPMEPDAGPPTRIHGTPEPGLIGRTQSSGCVRLTNWSAMAVAAASSVGLTVSMVE